MRHSSGTFHLHRRVQSSRAHVASATISLCARVQKRSPMHYNRVMHGTYQRGSTLLACLAFQMTDIAKQTTYDYNVINGPDWGHSELVFRYLLQKRFQHKRRFSLIHYNTLLVSSTYWQNHSLINYIIPKTADCKEYFFTYFFHSISYIFFRFRKDKDHSDISSSHSF